MSDNLPTENESFNKFRPFAEMLVSLRFLTRLPIPFARTIDAPPLAQSMRFFGFAGAMIGAGQGLALWALQAVHLPGFVVATLTTMIGIIVTGALHEDGLADSVDGLFGGQTRERRLEIMRDSRIGTYGASALMLALLVRIGAYQALLGLPPASVVLLLAAAGAFSRAMVVDMMWATRPARSDGLSVVAGRPGRNSALFAIITAGALTLFAGSFIRADSGIIALAAAGCLTALVRRLAMRLIGGQTGDICGAVQIVAELGMLVGFTATIN